jgi:uncharacterized membrane protein
MNNAINVALFYLTALGAIVLLDVLWLKYSAGEWLEMAYWPYWRNLNWEPKWAFAVLFYLIYSIWIAFGIIWYRLQDRRRFKALLYSAFVGFALHTLYQLIYVSLHPFWRWDFVGYDILWGTAEGWIAGSMAWKTGVWLGLFKPAAG